MWINRQKQTTLPISLPAEAIQNQFKFDDSYFLIDVSEQTPTVKYLHYFFPYTLHSKPVFRTNTDWYVEVTGVNNYLPITSSLEIQDVRNFNYCKISSPFSKENTLSSFYVLSTEESPTLSLTVKYTFTNIVNVSSLYRLLYSSAYIRSNFSSDKVNAEPTVEELPLLIQANPEHTLEIDLSYSILENNEPKYVFNTLLNYSKVKLAVFDNQFNITDSQTVAKYKNRYLKNLSIEELVTTRASCFLPEFILCRM